MSEAYHKISPSKLSVDSKLPPLHSSCLSLLNTAGTRINSIKSYYESFILTRCHKNTAPLNSDHFGTLISSIFLVREEIMVVKKKKAKIKSGQGLSVSTLNQNQIWLRKAIRVRSYRNYLKMVLAKIRLEHRTAYPKSTKHKPSILPKRLTCATWFFPFHMHM